MTGRVYSAEFNAVSVSAVQDLFLIQSTSGMAFRLLEIIVGQVTVTTVEELRVSFKRFSGAYTAGTGGTAFTPSKHNFGDSAATVTCFTNATTQTSGGTSAILRADTFNEVNGYQYLAIPDREIIIAPSQALVVSLDTAPAAARVMSGTLTLEELF
jgi:hypothetical protein